MNVRDFQQEMYRNYTNFQIYLFKINAYFQKLERNLLLDVRGSVHHSKIHREKSNKMQQCIQILLFYIYMKLNMFRATHRPSSGA